MTATLTSLPSSATSLADWSTSGRHRINDMSQNALNEERKRLQQHAETGAITPAQAARLREINHALDEIRRATRGW